ncbi:hypothetical protein BT93_J0360 [Corymbia citriodora subsp. variegata]|nr:hypothetical protein BT93_J0360 [Corymbia citriodora subsp. variegata]
MAFECQEGSHISESLSRFVVDSLEEHLNSKERISNSAENCNGGEHLDSKVFDLETTVEETGKSDCTLEFKFKKGNSRSYDRKEVPCNGVVSCFPRSFTDLPPALVSEILNCLDPKELGVVSCVSTLFHRLASEHHAWKEFYRERWGLPVAPASLGSGCSDEKSWKELFVERDFRSKTFMGRYNVEVLYGHTEAVRTVFLLASAKLLFTAGYDSTVRMWDLEEGLSISSSRSLGCTMRAVAADTKLLVVGGTDGFIHGWRAVEGISHLFDLRGHQSQSSEFRLWEHVGAVTSLALDLSKIYSGSWDMTVRIWDRTSLKCLRVLRHGDWIWGLVPHDTTVATSSGSDVYIWDINSGTLMTVIQTAHVGNAYSLARSHTGDFLFTGGEDGAIHMFEISHLVDRDFSHVASWIPHSGPVHALAFEFPWLVSASADGQLALIDVRKLLRTKKSISAKKILKTGSIDRTKVEPPQRMLHGFSSDLFSVDIGADRIVCGGEEGVVRVWNFSQALEIERRARALRGIRLENRMRRRRLQIEMNSKGGRTDQCSVAAKNSVNGDRSGVWHSKRGMSGKLKA